MDPYNESKSAGLTDEKKGTMVKEFSMARIGPMTSVTSVMKHAGFGTQNSSQIIQPYSYRLEQGFRQSLPNRPYLLHPTTPMATSFTSPVKPYMSTQDFRLAQGRGQSLLHGSHLLLPTKRMETPSKLTNEPYMATKPGTSIPKDLEWMQATSTPEDREDLSKNEPYLSTPEERDDLSEPYMSTPEGRDDLSTTEPYLSTPEDREDLSTNEPYLSTPKERDDLSKNGPHMSTPEERDDLSEPYMSTPEERDDLSKTEPYMSTPEERDDLLTNERYMSTKPCTAIPKRFEWMHATSTPEERDDLLMWADAAANNAEKKGDYDESERLIEWAASLTSTFAEYPDPQAYDRYLLLWSHSTSKNAAPDERKRLFRWKHSAPRSITPDGHERLVSKCLLKRVHPALSASFDVILEPNRWSVQEEILNIFETAMRLVQIRIEKRYALIFSDTDLRHKHVIYSCKGEPGLYQWYCQNALWRWPELIRGSTSSESDSGPIIVAENFKEWISRSDMIEERPSTNKLGFVTVKLSGKWIAKSLQKMLQDGIDTWAPKLTVKRVIVDCPLSDVEMRVDWFRLLPIVYTLMSILEFSKIDVTLAHRTDVPKYSQDGIFNRWFPCKKRGGYVVIEEKVPYIIPQTDFENAYKDIFALGYGILAQEADWIVCVTPTRQQVYTEMCLAAAKLEGWISNDRQKTPGASYVGYRSCNTEVTESLLEIAERTYEAVLEGGAAKLLGYTAEEVLDCVYRYTSLVNHRLAVCKFDVNMFDEKENTFVYLLNTRARIRRITIDCREEIIELKKSSVLILDKDEGWEKGEERILGFHLLEFTEVLEESCLSVLPHILCEYLYDLAKKFNRYHSSLYEDLSVTGTSMLLLYEATDAVMEKCFHLLGISPGVVSEKFSDRSGITLPSSLLESPMTVFRRALLLSTVERPMDLNARDPTGNFRFELFSFCSNPGTPLWYNKKGLIFGQISATDKFGLRGSHSSESDLAYVSLFNEDWRNPIKINDLGLVYIGNPSSGHPVSFSRLIEICLELYMVSDKNEGYQVCDDKEEIDLSEFWDKKSDGLCGCLSIESDIGHTQLYYMLLRDAIDTALEIEVITETDGFACSVRGYIVAHYGDDFLYESQSQTETICKDNYMALLFRAEPPYLLTDGIIQLIKSVLAVPTKGSLIIKAYLEDAKSGKVIMDGCCKFKPVLESDCISGTIAGTDGCSLDVKVRWNYSDRYL